jgi:hypothetical protein
VGWNSLAKHALAPVIFWRDFSQAWTGSILEDPCRKPERDVFVEYSWGVDGLVSTRSLRSAPKFPSRILAASQRPKVISRGEGTFPHREDPGTRARCGAFLVPGHILIRGPAPTLGAEAHNGWWRCRGGGGGGGEGEGGSSPFSRAICHSFLPPLLGERGQRLFANEPMLLRGKDTRAERVLRSVPAHLLIILLLLPKNGVADAEIARRSSLQHRIIQLRGGGSSDVEESSSSSSSSSGSGRLMFMTPSWQAEADAIKAKWRQKPPPPAVVGPVGVGELRQEEEMKVVDAGVAQTRLTRTSTPSNPRSPPDAIEIIRTPAAATAAAPSKELEQQTVDGGGKEADSTVGDTSIGKHHHQQQLPAEEAGRLQAVELDRGEEGSGGESRKESGMPRIPPVDLDRIMADRIRMLEEMRAAEQEVMRIDLDRGRGRRGASIRDDRGEGGGGGVEQLEGGRKLGIIEQVCVCRLGFGVWGLRFGLWGGISSSRFDIEGQGFDF